MNNYDYIKFRRIFENMRDGVFSSAAEFPANSIFLLSFK